MRSFGHVIFISLSNEDETDPIFDMMAPMELVLQGTEDATSTTRRHIFHFDGKKLRWSDVEIKSFGRSMRARSISPSISPSSDR